jgi:CHASE2 domain-containing sensor protein
MRIGTRQLRGDGIFRGMETTDRTQDVNALLDEARVPTGVKVAAGALAAAAVLTALVGLQNVTLIQWRGWMMAVPLLLLVVGVAAGLVAAKLARGRGWSLAAGIALGGALVVSTTGFLILSFLSGVFALLAILAVAASIAAVILQLVSVETFRHVAETRRRLRETGYDLDF